MSARALALHWSTDGSLGLALSIVLAATACLYLLAARTGRRRDRRGRAWPRQRAAAFLAGLGVLAVDLYSGLGAQADVRLSAHMVQHMVMWVVVAPLLCAGAPLRLAFFALGRDERRALARWLHAPVIALLTSPAGSVAVFSAVVAITHIPAVYDLALRDPGLHAGEHALYLISAVLVWTPVLGADPLPHRVGPPGRALCLTACMLVMVAIGAWLELSPTPVYGHYVASLGAGALGDQRVAAAVMVLGCLPALAVPALRHLAAPRRGPRGIRAERAPA
jgi:cytochrome c oxidase assembly factor CtaG